jgi:two-component system, NarL family, sensor histidine kinase UhpB
MFEARSRVADAPRFSAARPLERDSGLQVCPACGTVSRRQQPTVSRELSSATMHSEATIAVGVPAEPDAPASAPPVRLGVSSLRALWHRRSLRAQLLVAFVAIDLATALVAGAVTVVKARASTRVEITASMKLAKLLVTETISLFQERTPAEALLASLPLQLRFLRHVRIVVTDAAGTPVVEAPSRPNAGTPEGRARAPGWFEALIAPALERDEVPVVVGARRIGSVWIIGEPRDEIAEAWENMLALGGVAACVNLAVIGMLYILFGRVLTPLTGLADGLSELERRNYQVRLARPHARELALITERFNVLASALDAARTENANLTGRLIRAQDDERRRTALELHDEVGPSLFGLKANATSIATAAGELGEAGAARRIETRVHDMLAIVEHLQAINRGLLNRLRPMALGHVPLRDLLADMVRERARQHPRVAIGFVCRHLRPSYGDSIDLTVYRCVQEGLTNALRHADATVVEIELAERDRACETGSASRQLEVTVEDNGRGVAFGAPKGFGVLGMEERVQALGGTLTLENRPTGGACVRATIPIGIGCNEPDGGFAPAPGDDARSDHR